MLSLTEEQVIQLAPDSASAKAGSQLAVNSKWSLRAKSEVALWGYCQGSGKDPYFTIIDTQQLAFKCTCPSRKFPCKHGIGLLLLYTRDVKGFADEAMPDKVVEWISKRQEKESKKEEKNQSEGAKSEKEIEASKHAANKRAESRERKVRDGVEELRAWLKDIVRTGSMNLPATGGQFASPMAARLVDAQASGLAGMVRNLSEINFYNDNWPVQLTAQLSKLFLATECFLHEDRLPENFQREIRTLIGWNIGKDEVLNTPAIQDKWLILSKRMEEVQEMNTEQIWMYGLHTHQYAVILNFYFGAQLPQHVLIPGLVQEAELCYYPSVLPQRVLMKSSASTHSFLEPPTLQNWEQVLHKLSTQLAQFPLLYRMPVLIENVKLFRYNQQWVLIDAENRALPMINQESECWKALAWSGGVTFSAFVLYEAGSWKLEAVWRDENFVSMY